MTVLVYNAHGCTDGQDPHPDCGECPSVWTKVLSLSVCNTPALLLVSQMAWLLNHTVPFLHDGAKQWLMLVAKVTQHSKQSWCIHQRVLRCYILWCVYNAVTDCGMDYTVIHWCVTLIMWVMFPVTGCWGKLWSMFTPVHCCYDTIKIWLFWKK